MLFNSYTFFFFLIIVVILSRLIYFWKARKVFLLLASYLFYSAWNPPFVILLWISTLADWFIAKKIYKTKRLSAKRVFLVFSLSINLGLLAYFKYGEFILDNLIFTLRMIGLEFQPLEMNIILPVGISFYTFQTLSYSIDIYKGHTKPWPSFLDYALYVTFFPQLVAGPIVRAREFLPQCLEPKKASINQISWGLILLVIGLFNKVVIADTFMAPIVEQTYDSDKILTFLQAWAGTIAFSVQIFCDFAGYSTCAIGVALMLGFTLPDNFKFPYAAIGFSDFWRRWHISLSTWLRDYLYISLGGNRKGNIRIYANLMITMLIGGLWHGASWLFVIWGGLHGAYLLMERVVKKLKISQNIFWDNGLIKILLSLFTFALICIAWVFFRVETLSRAMGILSSMFGINSFKLNADLVLAKNDFVVLAIIAFGILTIHWTLRGSSIENLFKRIPWWTQSVIITILIFSITISMSGADRAFIYFQF